MAHKFQYSDPTSVYRLFTSEIIKKITAETNAYAKVKTANKTFSFLNME